MSIIFYTFEDNRVQLPELDTIYRLSLQGGYVQLQKREQKNLKDLLVRKIVNLRKQLPQSVDLRVGVSCDDGQTDSLPCVSDLSQYFTKHKYAVKLVPIVTKKSCSTVES